MVLRAKTKNLFSGKELTLKQQMNSQKNIEEMNMCVGGGEQYLNLIQGDWCLNLQMSVT